MSDLVLNQPLRHDMRSHLNDIYLTSQCLLKLHLDADTQDLIKGQMASVELIQRSLDMTMPKKEEVDPTTSVAAEPVVAAHTTVA